MQEQDNGKDKEPLSNMEANMAQEVQHSQAASQALSEPCIYIYTLCAAYAVSNAF